MNSITKKTAFGATAAAAALVVVGIASPALADDTSTITKGYSYASHTNTESPVVVAPDVDLLGGDNLNGTLGGDILTGDIANGNAVASGNEVNAPIVSGNETAIGNGNSTEVSDLVDNATDTSVSDLVDVSDILGDVSGWVNLEGMFD